MVLCVGWFVVGYGWVGCGVGVVDYVGVDYLWFFGGDYGGYCYYCV